MDEMSAAHSKDGGKVVKCRLPLYQDHPSLLLLPPFSPKSYLQKRWHSPTVPVRGGSEAEYLEGGRVSTEVSSISPWAQDTDGLGRPGWVSIGPMKTFLKGRKALGIGGSFVAMLIWATTATFGAPMQALIVDGQNNHDWKGTTPLLKKYLEETGLFTVRVATSPAKGGDMSGFLPSFEDVDVVISNYNGEEWPEATRLAFEKFVASGGGFVSVHAANNAFPNWKAYNEMIGLGGWGGRTEKDGPYIRYWQGKIIRVEDPGKGGSHGNQHAFLVEHREPEHPILKGLPSSWLHAQDELYDRLRGPARNLTVLATAYSNPNTRGSGHNEPMLMTVQYGEGRVFHTTLGHARSDQHTAMKCAGFIVTFQRGAEWAASGKVTQGVPADFPTKSHTRVRE